MFFTVIIEFVSKSGEFFSSVFSFMPRELRGKRRKERRGERPLVAGQEIRFR